MPQHAVELADAGSRHDDPFGDEQRSLQHLAAAVPAQAPAGRDDAVAGNVGPVAVAHDVSDGPRRARFAGQRRDVAVGPDAARRNAPDRCQDTCREIRGGCARFAGLAAFLSLDRHGQKARRTPPAATMPPTSALMAELFAALNSASARENRTMPPTPKFLENFHATSAPT